MMKIRFFKWTLFLLILGTHTVFSQTIGKQTIGMLEESPAGMKTIRFIKAVNKDLTADEKFVTTNFTSSLIEKSGKEKLLKILTEEISSNDGKLTVYSVNRPTTFKYEYLVEGSKSGWLKIIFHIDSQNPYRIKVFELDGLEKPDDLGDPMGI